MPRQEEYCEVDGGVNLNPALLTGMNETIGKEVLVETCDGRKYKGIFAACSQTMDLGLRFVYEITDANADHLLPLKQNVNEKMQFGFNEVLCMSVIAVEEKVVKGFATDRDYHGARSGQQRNGSVSVDPHEELEAWDGGHDDDVNFEIDNLPQTEQRPSRYQGGGRNNGGWDVDEMFKRNNELGVTSTFDDDLSQYTTADVVGSAEDRARAERIAREIENAPQSRHHQLLENDDEERDLDKLTAEEELEGRRKGAGGYAHRGGRGAGPAVTNRRAEGLKANDRRGSGPNQRGYGGPGGAGGFQQGGGRGGGYAGGKQRPSGQDITDDFNNWQLARSGSKQGGGGGGGGQQQGQGQAEHKVYENSNYKQQGAAAAGGKTMLEQRQAAPAGSARNNAQRVNELRGFQQDFNKEYRGGEGGKGGGGEETARGNAWKKGPPVSLVAQQQQQAAGASGEPAQADNAPVPAPAAPAPSDVETAVVAHTAEQTEMPAGASASSGGGADDSKDSDPNTSTSNSSTGDKTSSTFKFNANATAFIPKAPSQPPTQQQQQQPSQQMAMPPPVVSQPMPPMVPMQPLVMPQSSMPPPAMMTQGVPMMVAPGWQQHPVQVQYVMPGQGIVPQAARQMVAVQQQQGGGQGMPSGPPPTPGGGRGGRQAGGGGQQQPAAGQQVFVQHPSMYPQQPMNGPAGYQPVGMYYNPAQAQQMNVPPPSGYMPAQMMVPGPRMYAQHQPSTFVPQGAYVMPQQGGPQQGGPAGPSPRFPTPAGAQQPGQPMMDAQHQHYHAGQAGGAPPPQGQSTAGSQPPTPAPQQVASPAQCASPLPLASSQPPSSAPTPTPSMQGGGGGGQGGGGGAQAVLLPPHLHPQHYYQQMAAQSVHAAQAHHMHPHAQMYMYGQQQQPQQQYYQQQMQHEGQQGHDGPHPGMQQGGPGQFVPSPEQLQQSQQQGYMGGAGGPHANPAFFAQPPPQAMQHRHNMQPPQPYQPQPAPAPPQGMPPQGA